MTREDPTLSLVETVADDLVRIVQDTAPQLKAIRAERAALKTSDTTWSITEILGHLLDSAVNNQQRFVRAQQAAEFTFPGYEQMFWVSSQRYNDSPWQELVTLWVLYNKHLAQVIHHIPLSALSTPCTIGTSDPMTLEFLVKDYPVHLKHHLAQIRERSAA